jgi:glycosyltransferase involved in cell wall biosynthesis/nucleotide-binding universal stress UspA family protein
MENRTGNTHIRPAPPPEPPKPFTVLIPVASLAEARFLLPLAEMIVKERHGQLIILHVLTVPDGKPLSEAAALTSRFRESLNESIIKFLTVPTQVKSRVRVESDKWEGIWEIVNQDQADLFLVGWRTPSFTDTVGDYMLNEGFISPPCDIVAVRLGSQIIAEGNWALVKKILLPIRGGSNSTLVLRIGHAIAQQTNAAITLLHVTKEGKPETGIQFMDEFSPAIHGLERIDRSITTRGDLPQSIITEAFDHQVVIIGSPSNREHGDGWSGPLIDQIIDKTDPTLIVVRAYQKPAILPHKKEVPVTKPIDRPVAVVVDKWFAENTYHSREFADLKMLVDLKENQGLTISLGLPALNEEKTVGNVIQTIRDSLVDQYPLLDEIVLIDSGSIDYTRDIAVDMSIPVYLHQEILPQHGSHRGKGEALWKSLYVMSGDIVIWIDTDIKNIHPRFVYGVLGPLLRDHHVQFVKGYYRRPLRQGEKLVAGGGGRVTELTARPFFNLFFPELSGLIQPLAGEYAGRREILERLPFFTGYGVETGLLIDILNNFGLSAIAQVDLLERIHHNQPLPSLSKMSFTIMQVVINRLEKRHKVRLLDRANLTMNLIRFGPNRYFLEPQELQEHERPPIVTIPEYRLKRNITSSIQYENLYS